MKFFENKKFFQKMIIAVLIVMIFTFVFSCKVQAKSEIGGKLLKPVVSLITSLGDGLMDVIHNALIHQNNAYIRIDLSTSIWTVLGLVFSIVAGAVIAGAIVYFTAGVAVPAIVAKLSGSLAVGLSAGTLTVAIISGAVVGGAVYHSNQMSDDLVLPLYAITPEEIFSGDLAIFDVDFFNPNTNTIISSSQELETEECSGIEDAVNKIKERYNLNVDINENDFADVEKGHSTRKFVGTVTQDNEEEYDEVKNVYIVLVKGTSVIGQAGNTQPDRYYIGISRENTVSSIAYKLRPTVAAWYIVLRNLAIVGSLSILIYIAIRIIISSSSSDKAKYKQRLYDWLISICLIFIMHYIMAGSNLFVDKLSGMLNSVQKPKYIPVMVLDDANDKQKIKRALTDNVSALVSNNIIKDESSIDDLFTVQDGKETFIWPTNLMGILRIQTQMVKQKSTVAYAGYTILYGVLVLFTVSFTVTYLKRVLYLAFLTIIAPFVAMTYALDKLKDGSAQGFNNWFKEYMVNLLIQPIHLLLYTVLVSSAIQLAESNLIYGIVAIGFMMPAEKLVRRFFGINATETQGLLAGPAGAALVMSGVNKLLGHRPPAPHNDRAQSDADIKNKINYKDSLDTDDIYGGVKGAVNIKDVRENTLPQADTSANSPIEEKTKDPELSEMPSTPDFSAPQANAQIPDATDDETVVSDEKLGDYEEVIPKKPTKSNVWDNYNANKKSYREYLEHKNKGRDKNITNAMKARRTAYNTKKKLEKPMNGLRRGLKFYGRGLGKNLANAINNGNPGRKMLGLAHGLGTAALAGGIGIAAGVASGDLTKTGQYAAAAALGGNKLGSSVSNWASGALNVPDAGEYFARGYYGDQEYEQKQRDKIIKAMKQERMNDEFIRDFSLRTKMSERDAKEYLEQDNFLEEGLKYGFSEANEFAAAKKAKDILNDQIDAFRYTKVVKNQGTDINSYEYDRKKKDAFMDSIRDKYRARNANVDKKQLDQATNIYYNRMLQISDAYYKK